MSPSRAQQPSGVDGRPVGYSGGTRQPSNGVWRVGERDAISELPPQTVTVGGSVSGDAIGVRPQISLLSVTIPLAEPRCERDAGRVMTWTR